MNQWKHGEMALVREQGGMVKESNNNQKKKHALAPVNTHVDQRRTFTEVDQASFAGVGKFDRSGGWWPSLNTGEFTGGRNSKR